MAANVAFDRDLSVSVFETNIRALGGLLAAHLMIEEDPSLLPAYDGALLVSATDLGRRLLAAFDTPTGTWQRRVGGGGAGGW